MMPYSGGVLRTGLYLYTGIVLYDDKVLGHLSGVCAVHILASRQAVD
jgi:hypothetical protein